MAAIHHGKQLLFLHIRSLTTRAPSWIAPPRSARLPPSREPGDARWRTPSQSGRGRRGV